MRTELFRVTLGLALGIASVAGCTIQQRTPRAAAGSESALRVPPDSEIPIGPLGASIRRGRALLRNTPDSMPDHVGSALRCFSCHLGEGTQANALPLVGVYSRFPQYRSRNGLVNLLEDRINDCFERSLNGKAVPRDGRNMRDLVAYFAFISRAVAPPGELPGIALRQLERLPADTTRGRAVFAQVCARCHGPDGAGTSLAPPVWGPRSFNIGAGMARLRTATAFIRDNMPNDRAVVLSDQQAFDVAAYVVSRPRPDFARKADDWPNGDPPEDVAYPTRAAQRKAGSMSKP
ncbi:MAG TPA: c-type cytochrome [Gemmatimonadales bacterium]|nr:c-type cytochrome [Gemmatimonadales bacterium]